MSQPINGQTPIALNSEAAEGVYRRTRAEDPPEKLIGLLSDCNLGHAD
jgi:hypothetical protein